MGLLRWSDFEISEFSLSATYFETRAKVLHILVQRDNFFSSLTFLTGILNESNLECNTNYRTIMF